MSSLFEPGEMEALAEQARAQVQEAPPTEVTPAVEAAPTGDPPPVDDPPPVGTPPPVTKTSAPSNVVEEATERAMGYETLVSDARKKAELDAAFAEAAAESAGPGDTAVMRGRLEGAKAKGAEAIRAAEEQVTTPLAGGAGKSTVPILTGFGKDDDPVNVFVAAARVAAKQKQVEDDSGKADAKRKSKIRELAEIRRQPKGRRGYAHRGYTAGQTTRITGLSEEIDELGQQIENLGNLSKALESIRVKTLGDLPVKKKMLQEEKKKLEGEPTEFDPERSRRAQ